MEDKARERIALLTYLAWLVNPQVVFWVCKKTPKILDAAIAATLELESYLPQKLTSVSSVEVAPVEEDLEQATINVVSQGSGDKLVDTFEKLSDLFY